MARYIDADKFYQKLDKTQTKRKECTVDYLEVFEMLDDIPTADVVEVKHGKWVETKEWYFDEYAQSDYQRKCYECSICKRTEQYKEPYCHCGAKMDGGKEK